MKRRNGLIMAVLMLACSAPGQADEAAAIKKNLEQMWSDIALGKIDPSNFGEQTLPAYSSGGLWQKLSGEELSASIVAGPRLHVKPYHIKITFLGAQKACRLRYLLSRRQY